MRAVACAGIRATKKDVGTVTRAFLVLAADTEKSWNRRETDFEDAVRVIVLLTNHQE